MTEEKKTGVERIAAERKRQVEMGKGFNPETITLPPELEGRQWLTFEEFGSLCGKGAATIRYWRRKGIVKTTQFTPRCNMIPISEVDRLRRGELMEGAK